MSTQRVVITGLGTINSLGKNASEFSSNLKAGRTGIKEIPSEHLRQIGISHGGYVENFNPEEHGINPKINRTIQFGLVAAREAINDSKFDLKSADPFRIGVCIGTAVGNYSGIETYYRNIQSGSETELLELENIPASQIGLYIAQDIGCNGPVMTTVTACAAGANSIGYGMELIRSGTCDMVLVGGADPLTFLSQTGFHLMLSLSSTECRPFNKEKSGILVGEGSAIMVLESEDAALKRGVRIYSEVMGCGLSNDAYHPTAPDPKGEGAYRSMTWALRDAGIKPEEIEYVNAHGTGTKLNDQMELAAMEKVFGDRLKNIPISSIKGAIGHTLGLAGSIETLSCVLGMADDYIPPTINMIEPMVENYDFVMNESRTCTINKCISNSFGFGGNTATVVLRRYAN